MDGFPHEVRVGPVVLAWSDGFRTHHHESDRFHVLVDGYFVPDSHLPPGTAPDNPDPQCPYAARATLLDALFSRLGHHAWQYLEGCFLAVIIDKQRHEVHCATDRLGSKRILYTRNERHGTLVLSDRFQILRPSLDTLTLDPAALTEHLYFRWLVGDRYLFSGVSQMLAAEHLTVTADLHISRQRYWSFQFDRQELHGSLEGWADATQAAFDRLFARLKPHYRKPAILLSGGVDSSLILAMAARHFEDCIAVTPVWHTGETPELEAASNFARHLGIPHLKIEVTDDDLRRACERLHRQLEQLPRHFSSMPLGIALERMPPDVDLVLHGDAGDSYFGESDAHVYATFASHWQRWQLVPKHIRKWIAGSLTGDSPVSSGLVALYGRLSGNKSRQLKKKLNDFCNTLLADPRDVRFHYEKIYTRHPMSTYFPCVDGNYQPTNPYYHLFENNNVNWLESCLLMNLEIGIRNNAYTIDRISVNRHYDIVYPFLSEELRLVGARLPLHWHGYDQTIKPVLKYLASCFYPREWTHFRKLGFATPVREWLQGPLAECLELLSEPRTRDRGFIAEQLLEDMPLRHGTSIAWSALQLEKYMRTFLDSNASNDGTYRLSE